LAKFLAPANLGLYGLLAATVGYGVYAVGFEFYAVSMRELIGSERSRWLTILRDQLVFHGFTYAVVVPVLVGICAFGVLPWAYLPWLIALLVLEHLGVEINRILIATAQPVLAGVLLFVRTGAWGLLVVGLMWVEPQLRTLSLVFWSWTIAALIGCTLGVLRIATFAAARSLSAVNWNWIRSAVAIAMPLLVASLAVRGIFTLDRYWVGHIAGLDAVGAYVVFVGLATAVLSFLDAAVIDFAYPRVVAAAKRRDVAQFRAEMRVLALQVLGTTALLAGGCAWFSGVLLQWLGRADYLRHRSLLPWLLGAVALYGCSMVPHVGLYAWGRDRALMRSQLCGLGAFVAGCAVLTPLLGVQGVPRAMCIGFAAILSWKLLAYAQLRRDIDGRV
jgi:O-antigen/teichoic acid export membrane protein